MPEAWLRGPVDGVSELLMPAVHSLIDAGEEIAASCSNLTPEELWMRPGGAAAIGFHLRHVAGSIDRLLTYAAGGSLSAEQFAALKMEEEQGTPAPAAPELIDDAAGAIDRAIRVMKAADPASLFEPRKVGRAELPTTVFGLFFHIAEHTRRHAGQIIATSRFIRAAGSHRESTPPTSG